MKEIIKLGGGGASKQTRFYTLKSVSKIPHAATKIWGSQKISKVTKTNLYFRLHILRH